MSNSRLDEVFGRTRQNIIEEMKRKAMKIEEKMYAVDWNQYDMRSFPSKIYDVREALDKISNGLYVQFLM